jgi:hypothetical protein
MHLREPLVNGLFIWGGHGTWGVDGTQITTITVRQQLTFLFTPQ